jgi:acyl-CoA synthetase (AMP-forming)/AMP-acid ligase II
LVHAKQHYAQRMAMVDCFNTAPTYPEDCANITTYGQLYDHVLGLAGHLQSVGVGKGSRVAVMLRNCAEVGHRTHGIAAIVALSCILATAMSLRHWQWPALSHVS